MFTNLIKQWQRTNDLLERLCCGVEAIRDAMKEDILTPADRQEIKEAAAKLSASSATLKKAVDDAPE